MCQRETSGTYHFLNDMAIDPKAADMLSRGWYKEKLDPEECVYLLTFREKSSEANLAVSLANRLMHRACSDVGQITANITVSSGPCPGNCGFCEYAEGHYPGGFFDIDDAVLARYAEEIGGFSDVRNIRLTTCADADISALCRQVGIVRDHARRGTRIFVDTKDLESDDCRRLKEAGAYGAVHSCRIGEGRDTEFKPETRLRTVRNIVSSGLQAVAGVGPIGPEQDTKEIIESFYTVLDLRCLNAEIYAREPVPGTRFSQYGKISPARFAQIKAVLSLASSRYDPPARNAFPGPFVSDQNNVVVGYDGKTGKERLEAARRRLFNNGFQRILRTDDSTVELSLMYLRQTGSV